MHVLRRRMSIPSHVLREEAAWRAPSPTTTCNATLVTVSDAGVFPFPLRQMQTFVCAYFVQPVSRWNRQTQIVGTAQDITAAGKFVYFTIYARLRVGSNVRLGFSKYYRIATYFPATYRRQGTASQLRTKHKPKTCSTTTTFEPYQLDRSGQGASLLRGHPAHAPSLQAGGGRRQLVFVGSPLDITSAQDIRSNSYKKSRRKQGFFPHVT